MNESTEKVLSNSANANDSEDSIKQINLQKDVLIMEENFEDLPQAIAESYGTGVKEVSSYTRKGSNRKSQNLNEASPELTGGDVDANYEQAYADGDESVGGTVVTPDMDIVDDLGKAVGLEIDDVNFLHSTELLEQRDEQRWELEPTSSEDYQERRDEDFLDT